ncbi:ABC transporter ATP-binding protein [Synechococcus sp. R55.6]|jgi:phospholipid/cholesterol/gamma-HCH transport system ATP-binding protein|uniref:ABC transporter ATP-binding protein n=1 Tax=unclassified Synechococcus TaxID=2626047 RepID=UPI0039C057B3
MPAVQSTAPLVELRQVSKRFGSTVVLDHVDLKVYRGEALGLVGPSGTGKSTLLRIIAGLTEPDAGEVLWCGIPLPEIQAHHATPPLRVGMVFQQAALFDSLTVEENVGFLLYEHSQLPRSRIRELVAAKLEAVGLAGKEHNLPEELSGGMRKRASFARAIMEDPSLPQDEPQLLLYDEPTAGLDPIASTVIEDLIRELQQVKKACESYIVVTHQHSTIYRATDRIVLLAQGRVQWEGSVQQIETCDNPFVRQFFSGSVEGPIQVAGQV